MKLGREGDFILGLNNLVGDCRFVEERREVEIQCMQTL